MRVAPARGVATDCWFGTYNFLDAQLPAPAELLPALMRNAAVGFGASTVADTATNTIRVLMTFRQTSAQPVRKAAPHARTDISLASVRRKTRCRSCCM
eukprot:5406546-Pleurochrysis_carterae.AAC.2